MTELTPNKIPDGQKCGTCRFAGTHVVAGVEKETQVRIKCRRYPPARRGGVSGTATLLLQETDNMWPVLTWDDWCGEWAPRVEDMVEVDIGPSLAAGLVAQMETLCGSGRIDKYKQERADFVLDRHGLKPGFFKNLARYSGSPSTRHLSYPQGSILNMGAPEAVEADTISVGGIVVKNRNGPVEGEYDSLTGIATRTPTNEQP